MPKIAVILPTVGRITLQQTLASIYGQKYQDFQVLVVDDSIRQDTKVDGHPNLVLLQTGGGKGVSFARNMGAKFANTEWLAFIDDDDVWHPDKLQDQISYANSNQLDLALTSANVVSLINSKRPKELLEIGDSPFKALYGKPHFLHSRHYFPTASMLVRSSVFKKFYFDENLRERENLLFLQTIFLSGARLAQMKDSLVTIRYDSRKSLGRIKIDSELLWWELVREADEEFAKNFAIESTRNFLREKDPINAAVMLSRVKMPNMKQQFFRVILRFLCIFMGKFNLY